MNLLTAIGDDDLVAATDLLQDRDERDRRGPDGRTPLMVASGLGRSRVVELLLTAGADVHALEPRMGSTALHKAAQSGDTDVIGLLLDHGSFIDQQSPVLGNTALMDAVLHKHEQASRVLLVRGARTTVRNHWDQSALDLARHDKLDVIADLIEARDQADREQLHGMGLLAAVKRGDASETARLLATDVQVDERSPVVGSVDDEYTALGVAARDGRADLVRMLLDAGADPYRVVGLMRGTPLHEASFSGHADVIQALTQASAQPGTSRVALDAQGAYNGLAALHDAVWHGHLEAARALVDAGASLELRTHAGLTPRALPYLYGYDDLAELLGRAERA